MDRRAQQALRSSWRGRNLLAGDPTNALSHLDRAEYGHALALDDEGIADAERLIVAAREGYARSFELDPSIPETWVMIGQTHLAPGQDPRLAIPQLEKAFGVLPSVGAIRMLLAEAYLATGQEGRARALITAAHGAHVDGDVESDVEEKIAEIHKRRVDLAKRAREAVGEGSAPPAEQSGALRLMRARSEPRPS